MAARKNFPLSDTSALVLLWVGDGFYRTPAARAYLRRLDLSAGLPLYRECEAVWPHYAEVIYNRKFAVRHLAVSCAPRQIVIAGAGLDAMGLELAESLGGAEVFELDRAQMADKQKLIAQMGGVKNLHCLQADLTRPPQAMAALGAGGWCADVSTLLILEGISYYLSETALAALVAAVQPQQVIVDFLRPAETLPPAPRDIADGVFGAIERACNLAPMTRYSAEKLAQVTKREVSEHWTMKRIEESRLGAAQHFAPPFEGWIEICALK